MLVELLVVDLTRAIGVELIKDHVNLLIVRNEIVLYIPSSFTPNGDGINDVFMVFGQDIKQFEMQVYNRWGEKIFHTYDAESGWDGRSNSSKEELDYGTYYYVVRVLDSKSNWHKIDGYINIIR